MKESVFAYLMSMKRDDICSHLYKNGSESNEIASRFILEGIRLGQKTVYMSDRDISDNIISRLNNNIFSIDRENVKRNTKFIKISNPNNTGSFLYSSFLEQAQRKLISEFSKQKREPLTRVILHKKPTLLNSTTGFDLISSAELNKLCKKLPLIIMYQFQLDKIDSEDLLHILKMSPNVIESDYVYASSFYTDPWTITNSEKRDYKINDLLTDQEIKILRGIINGLSNKVIAEDLSLSRRTVETHRANIMKKVGVNNLVDLVKLAIKSGFI